MIKLLIKLLEQLLSFLQRLSSNEPDQAGREAPSEQVDESNSKSGNEGAESEEKMAWESIKNNRNLIIAFIIAIIMFGIIVLVIEVNRFLPMSAVWLDVLITFLVLLVSALTVLLFPLLKSVYGCALRGFMVHPVLFSIAVFLIIIIFLLVIEVSSILPILAQWIDLKSDTLNAPITVLVILVSALTLLLFPLLKRVYGYASRVFNDHKVIFPIAFFLIIISFLTLFSSSNRWVFNKNNIEVGTKNLTPEEIATQFRGNLNAIGYAPLDKLIMADLAPPPVVTGIVKGKIVIGNNDQFLSSRCEEVMTGPRVYEDLGESPVILSRPSRASSTADTRSHSIDLDVSVAGVVNLPLGTVFQFLPQFSPNRHEFSIHVIALNDELDAGQNESGEDSNNNSEPDQIGNEPTPKSEVDTGQNETAEIDKNKSEKGQSGNEPAPEAEVDSGQNDTAEGGDNKPEQGNSGNEPAPESETIRIVVAAEGDEINLKLSQSGNAPTHKSETIRIVVADNKGHVWSVTGPDYHWRQMTNFLTHRMVNDLLLNSSSQSIEQDEDLARVLGHQAYILQDYESALAYYRLAESFEPGDDSAIQVVLGLTLFQLKEDGALEAFQQARDLGAENNNIIDLYLACVKYNNDNTDLDASKDLNNFTLFLNNYIKGRRYEQLRFPRNPPLGPGREISVYYENVDEVFHIYYILGSQFPSTIYYTSTTNLENLSFLPLDNNKLALDLSKAPENKRPRQVFAVKDGAFYLTSAGVVNFLKPCVEDEIRILSVKPLIDEESKNRDGDSLINNVGGIRQIFVDDPYLFVLGRLGQIARYEYSVSEDLCKSESIKVDDIPTEETIQGEGAKQIFLDLDKTLYVLKDDGVWRIPKATTGKLNDEIQLVAANNIREIAVSDGTIYQLLTNGQIWRYRNGVNGAFDLGSKTERILGFSKGPNESYDGLYLLKSDGAVWRIQVEERGDSGLLSSIFKNLGEDKVPSRILEPPDNDHDARKGIALVNEKLLVLAQKSDDKESQNEELNSRWLASNDEQSERIELNRAWTFAGQSGQIVTIEMKEDGSGIDTFLKLLGPDEHELTWDDDRGEGFNSRISDFRLPEDGSYTIIPSAIGRSSGAYRLLLTVTAKSLKSGEPMSGKIEDNIAWTFEGQAGQIVTINMRVQGIDSGIDTCLKLVQSNALEIAADDDEGDCSNSRTSVFILPQDGVYKIKPTRAREDASGAYTLSLTETRLLKSGEPASGKIEDDAVWAFMGQTGQIVTIEMQEDGSDINTFLSLLGPNRQVVAKDNDGGDGFNSRISGFPLPEDGVYRIKPKARDNDFGTYTLSLTVIANPLKPSEPASGKIEENIEWIFEGHTGQIVTIEMKEDGSGIDTLLRLLGPDGQVLAKDDNGDGESFNSRISDFSLTQDGLYTIKPRARDSASGAYTLLLTITTSPLKSGEPVSGKIEENIKWTFAGQFGQIVTIEMQGDDNGIDTFLRLLGPDGLKLEEDDDSGEGFNSRLSLSLPEDGIYTIMPRASDSSSGDYTISLTIATSPLGYREPANNRRLVSGDTVKGKIEENIEWIFAGQAGQTVSLEMHEDGSGIDTLLTLLGPDGQILVEADDDGEELNSRISLVLPEDGVYTIMPSALDKDDGAYTISLFLTEPTNRRLVPDDTVSVPKDENIQWTFAGQAGQVVTIEMQEDSSGIDTFLRLLGTDREVLAKDDNGGEGLNSRISDFVLPENGVYTIIPSALDGDDGAYTISLLVVEPATSRLVPDETVLGEIEDNFEWTFAGQFGQIVTIEMQEDDSGIDTFLKLVGPDGLDLVEDDDGGEGFNSRLSLVLPEDGVYTIIPSALDSISGAYTISLLLAEPATRRLAPGDTVLGKIEENIEWTFAGSRPEQSVTIEMQEDGSGIDTFLTLLGPDGQMLAEDDDGGDGRNSRISGFILQEDVIYKIIPKALGGSFGAYRISIIDE